MQIIKLDATDSTNAHLRRLLSNNMPEDYTVVAAGRQTHGRGQMGTIWHSENGKNLTFSVLRKDLNYPIDQGFDLNLAVSLAVYSVLETIQIPDLSIKWPNDILSGTSKLCGILIENKISGSKINTSIIGIGLNVNQIVFGENLSNVSSLKLVMGRAFDLDKLLREIVLKLKSIFTLLITEGPEELWKIYDKVLFRNGMHSTFETDTGCFQGFIKGVSRNGKLTVLKEYDDDPQEFGLKEVKLLL